MFGVSVGIMDGAGGAAGGSFESIQTATGTGSSATINFNSIPSDYKHLQIRYFTKTTNSSIYGMSMRLNGISTSSYSSHQLDGDGSSVSASGSASQTEMQLFTGLGSPGSDYTNLGAVGIIDLHDYASTTKNKTVRSFTGYDFNYLYSVAGSVGLRSGLFISTNAVTSVSITLAASNFSTQTVFSLYGIKG